MIPKIIHYCWFGGNPLPELAVRCIDSWKKHFPNYVIKEWNESNFDINCCYYVKEAYNAKKWAFVSDYARFWILYHEGGIYFDTDVEVIKDMSDIISKGAFMGCESTHIYADLGLGVNPGLGIGAPPGLGLYKEILDFYNVIHFVNENGALCEKTVVEYTTDRLVKYGFGYANNVQRLDCGGQVINIYPPEYFCPLNCETGKMLITEKTVSIHHYTASWLSKLDKLIAFWKYSNAGDKIQKNISVRYLKSIIKIVQE